MQTMQTMQPMMWHSNGDVLAARVNSRGQRVRSVARAGSKRPASESDLSDTDRFNKRFNLLSLGATLHASSNLYVGVDHAPDPVAAATVSRREHESMQLDDTRDRVYIYDLDAELRDEEPDEEKLIFLPDIERRLSKIPMQVLAEPRDDAHEGQELVLYTIPKSLTVDESHDSVRKAVIETRQRARENAAQEARHLDMNCKYGRSSNGDSIDGDGAGHVDHGMDLDDVMDLD